MFIREVRQMGTLLILSILFVICTTNMFSELGYMILMLWIRYKGFFSTIVLAFSVHLWNETNLDAHNIPHSFCYGHYNHVLSSLGYVIFMLWICKKSFFFSTIFLKINVHPWNEINLDIRNNLHCFCYVHHNHVLLIEIHDIDALDLQVKLLFPPFSL